MAMYNRVTGIFTSLVLIFLNGGSLFTVATSKRMEKRIKVMLIGHVLTDFGVGLTMLCYVLSIVYQLETMCHFSSYFLFILGVITSLMAILQTLDRFLVLRITYKYTEWITAKKMTIIVMSIYTVSIAAFFGMFVTGYEPGAYCHAYLSGGKIGYILSSVFFTVCIIAICGMYVYIGKEVRRLQKAIPTTDGSSNTTFSADNIRTMVTMAVTALLYTLCYIPMVIFMYNMVLFHWENRFQYIAVNWLFDYLSGVFYVANSIFNPIVYIWRLKKQRNHCRRLFGRCCSNSVAVDHEERDIPNNQITTGNTKSSHSTKKTSNDTVQVFTA
ncbi:hypothetical protein LOTGIDRAFT_171722 [Lottia gigantea]|uniref:G-protein coupled receptors family 1 profile domain-containing protein n=1 Tax=Lottia gigantea TaxID=225164 RepID=V4AGF1_LOTGI|nr:hypothetical protein LOTGIDRAFT_171722 [Lottia gigantea]ESP03119.1 hypothetical protein LOTGIDRAFT_171722 [Lottia gigantea]